MKTYVTSAPVGDGDEITAMIERDMCAKKYYALLEACLGENDRKFSKCQKEVHMLKSCTAALKDQKEKKE